ncbi:MAG: branched-chain amino acid ABC transporter permease [Clostridia bacterium]|nr:MAG: branched-chain amino acid ABC transporter permease [Clostridia bacterium]
MWHKFMRKYDTTDIVMWLIGLGLLVAVLYGTYRTLVIGKYEASVWLDFLIFGLAQGSVYALIALGYTLVYGILFMINFAHGEVFTGGVFTAYFVAIAMEKSGFIDRHWILALLILMAVAVSVSVMVAIVLERIAYRPLRGAPRLVPLITAIGASFFLQYTYRGIYGSGVKTYPDFPALDGKLHIFGKEWPILTTQALVIVVAGLMMVFLYWYVQKTKAGKAMRAVAEDKEAAALMGIDVDRVIVNTFALGGAMAGVAGILYALLFKQVNAFMGFIPGIKAFTAAVLGGIGNVPGAMLGGLFLGIFESIGPSLFLDGLGIPSPYQLKDAIAFTMLVLILIFRPSGIMGERLSEKKA